MVKKQGPRKLHASKYSFHQYRNTEKKKQKKKEDKHPNKQYSL